MAQSLTSALERQLAIGPSVVSTQNSAQPEASGFMQVSGQTNAQAAQDLAQRLLDQGAKLLAPPDPLEEGAKALVGDRLSGALVDELNHLGVDEKTLEDPEQRARFDLDHATNPFNLRKGLYEYNKGMIDALVKTLDSFFSPAGNQ
jgi:hypothetical protein